MVKNEFKPTIFLVHGFNDESAGARNIDKSAPFYVEKGYTVDKDEMDYGFINLIQVRLRKRPHIMRIANAVNSCEGPVVLIGYSNGCHYLLKALKYIFKQDVILILCSAALNRRIKIPANVSHTYVYHIKSDTTVWFASFIPWSKWGRMGAVGYKGKDLRVLNIDFSDIAAKHGGMWADEVVPYFVNHSDKLIQGSQ